MLNDGDNQHCYGHREWLLAYLMSQPLFATDRSNTVTQKNINPEADPRIAYIYLGEISGITYHFNLMRSRWKEITNASLKLEPRE